MKTLKELAKDINRELQIDTEKGTKLKIKEEQEKQVAVDRSVRMIPMQMISKLGGRK